MSKGLSLSIVVTGFLVYLVCVVGSYAVFYSLRPTGKSSLTFLPNLSGLAGLSGNTKKVADNKPTVTKKPDLPKTEECPINGAMYSKPDRDLWETRRPMGVMIENSRVARPQSGLSSSDVVYEAVAEGGITRFMAVFYCQDADVVGPVRSARTYFLDWISEYGSSPLYVHVGGANTPGPANALGQIEKYGWAVYNDLNQFSIGFPTFYRDYDRLGKDTATEHTVYAGTTKLWDFAAKKRKLTNVELDDVTGKETAWNKSFVSKKFKDDALLADRPDAFFAEFGLSSVQSVYITDYTVKWVYDKNLNAFLRFNGGVEHRDLNTNQQLTAKNVIIQYQTMSIADDGYDEQDHGSHTLYGNKGVGKAAFLIDGKMTTGTWKKKDRISPTLFFDEKGVEVKFNRGVMWIETLPVGQQIKTT